MDSQSERVSIKPNSSIAFRRAVVADCEELGVFFVRAWRESFAGIVPKASLDKEDPGEAATRCAELLANPARLAFVAVKNGRIVGTTFAILPDAGVNEGSIKSLFVDQACHRHGIGSTLMGLVASEFLNRGITSLTLGVFRDNHKARRFYEAVGGATIHEAPLEWDGHVFAEQHYRFDNLPALAAAVAATRSRKT